MITVYNTKQEIKSWIKSAMKNARQNKARESLFHLKFSIEGQNFTASDKTLIKRLKKYVTHCQECKIAVKNSSRVMKLSTMNKTLNKEHYEIPVGFYGADEYLIYEAVKARNSSIMLAIDALSAALALIGSKK